MAQEAVEELLTQAGVGLADVPQLEPLRRQLLEKALALHGRFLEVRADDPAVRLEAARAHRRMGEIFLLLGRPPSARDAATAGRAVLAQAADDDADAAVERARLTGLLGRADLDERDFGRAQDQFRAAREQFDALVSARPGDAAVRLLAAETARRLGEALTQGNRFAEAEPVFQAALTHLDALAPDDAVTRFERARTLIERGTLRKLARRPEQAYDDFEAAGKVYEPLAREFPQRRAYRGGLADAYSQRATLWATASVNRLADAVADYDKAIPAYRDLAKDFPGVPDYRERLANAQFGRAYALKRLNRQEEARADYEQAGAHFRALVDEFPGTATYRFEEAKCHNNLGSLLETMGRLDEAERESTRARDLYEALRVDRAG